MRACSNTPRTPSSINLVRPVACQHFSFKPQQGLGGDTDVVGCAGQDFKRVGLSTLTDLLNVVAPPISEHEVIQVWLSHDMQGYEGIESLVYRALSRVSVFPV